MTSFDQNIFLEKKTFLVSLSVTKQVELKAFLEMSLVLLKDFFIDTRSTHLFLSMFIEKIS